MDWNSISFLTYTKRGYHFLNGSYNEYKMNEQNIKDNDKFIKDLEKETSELISKNFKIKKEYVEYDKIKDLLGECPDYLPKNEPVRIISYGDVFCPCSGTHVNYSSEIEKIVVRKLKKKKGILKI
jgi:Ser-tRNA(Ala) deacylase AlaX